MSISDSSPDTALRDTPLVVPSVYRAGYEKARAVNPDLARRYIEHTLMGDPAGDAAVASLADFPQDEVHRLIHAGMEKSPPPPSPRRNCWLSLTGLRRSRPGLTRTPPGTGCRRTTGIGICSSPRT